MKGRPLADVAALALDDTDDLEVNGHEIKFESDEEITPKSASQSALEHIFGHVPQLSQEHLQELSSKLTAQICQQQQEANLKSFIDSFSSLVDADFKALQPELLQSFLTWLSGLKVKVSEQALDSTSSVVGTVTLAMAGLAEGVTVTRSAETFYVDEGNTLLERSELRVKMGGLDVYSGYWLAVDAPAHSIEDPLQEEGIDTLRRVMEAAGIPLTEDVFEDPLEYPFLSALLAPFGPTAGAPFEGHLRALHAECSQRHGGCWFRMSSQRKARSKLAEVAEVEDGAAPDAGAAASAGSETRVLRAGDSTAVILESPESEGAGRRRLTEAEEADLEIDKLDL